MKGSVLVNSRKMVQAVIALCRSLKKMRFFYGINDELEDLLTAEELRLILLSATTNSSNSCWPLVLTKL